MTSVEGICCPNCQRPVPAYVTGRGRYLAPHADVRGKRCRGSDAAVETIAVEPAQ